jgi:Immunoglobulin-like domain of bacterial spore germination/Sporulation and spore germination
MNDDRLHRLLSDAVSDVEPDDRLEAIRAEVHPDPKVVPVSSSRPWTYALGGIVATAAVIGVVAYATGTLPGLNQAGDTEVGVGQPSPSAGPSHHPTHAAPGSSTPTTSATSGTTSPTSQVYAVYYVGTDPRGRPVLFREFHRVSPAGRGADPLSSAVHDAITRAPLDPDYVSPWAGHATLGQARYDESAGTLTISLRGAHLGARPTGMSEAEAAAAIQQLVYTAQGAIGHRVPVTFLVGRQPAGQLFGVDVSQPVSAGRVLKTLSLVSISDPNNGDTVSGHLKVTGVNNGFEGTVVVFLERDGKRFLVTPTIGGMGGNKLFPWSVTLDLSKVRPGTYTLVARDDDPSGRGHAPVDDRVVVVK